MPRRTRARASDTDHELHKVKRRKGNDDVESTVEAEARYFLMKAEPESRIEKGIDVKFSIDDMKAIQVDAWDGVRSLEACKTMRTRMKLGDLAFFYHSNTKNPGIAGIVSVCKEGYPDSSAWTMTHPYFDPKTDKDKPRWFRVDVKYERHLKRFISLKELKSRKDTELSQMQLLRRPQLSVQRVSKIEWDHIIALEDVDLADAATTAQDTAEDNTPDADAERAESRVTQEEIIHTHGG